MKNHKSPENMNDEKFHTSKKISQSACATFQEIQ